MPAENFEEIVAPAFAVMSVEQKKELEKQRAEFLTEVNAAFEDILVTAPRVDLMEICCPPDSTLVDTFHEHGRSALRIGLPVLDLSTSAGGDELLRMVKRHRPRVL